MVLPGFARFCALLGFPKLCLALLAFAGLCWAWLGFAGLDMAKESVETKGICGKLRLCWDLLG